MRWFISARPPRCQETRHLPQR